MLRAIIIMFRAKCILRSISCLEMVSYFIVMSFIRIWLYDSFEWILCNLRRQDWKLLCMQAKSIKFCGTTWVVIMVRMYSFHRFFARWGNNIGCSGFCLVVSSSDEKLYADVKLYAYRHADRHIYTRWCWKVLGTTKKKLKKEKKRNNRKEDWCFVRFGEIGLVANFSAHHCIHFSPPIPNSTLHALTKEEMWPKSI